MGKAIAWFVGGVVVACIAALAAFYVLDLDVVDRDTPPEISTSTVTTTAAAQVTVPASQPPPDTTESPRLERPS